MVLSHQENVFTFSYLVAACVSGGEGKTEKQKQRKGGRQWKGERKSSGGSWGFWIGSEVEKNENCFRNWTVISQPQAPDKPDARK